MNVLNRIKAAIVAAACSLSGLMADGAAPAGYYSKCEGKTGQSLLTALYETISSHTTVSYNGLWSLYATSDVDENGKIWDMYSTKRWNVGEKCGSYKNIGDCYNREHSFPKSWFKEAKPMYSDAFHLYPTDGKVNGQRSNYPFGECANGTNLGTYGGVKALGRLGTSTFSGYSGQVFEPDDQYKGDFARSYFYMAACYNNTIATWVNNSGSRYPMLAGNSYPVFSTWALNLLLKWSRNDEVSEKETKRNDAVYAQQKNRNPFIDHPELVEYIWGDKVGTPWHEGAISQQPAKLTQPANYSTISLGYAAVGITRTVEVLVKGTNLTEPVSIFTIGGDYTVTPTTLTAEQVNNGYNVTVSCKSSSEGDAEGSLNIITNGSTDDIATEVDLITLVESGLPIYDATDVTSSSFVVRWVYLHDATTYTLDVRQGNSSIPGYPRSVTASAESYTVTGLDPLTDYTFYLTSGSLTSAIKNTATAELLPMINVMFDGDLDFATTVGEPSDVAELLLDIENIAETITISVNSPFQVSTDKTNWGTAATLDPEEDRIYMRLYGNNTGSYQTSITCTAGAYENDDAEATGTISEAVVAPAFIETFNVDGDYANSYGPYKDNVTFTGTATDWKLIDAGIGTTADDKKIDTTYAIRFGKEATSALEMAADKTGGIGTVKFETMKWKTDADVTAVVEYSGDGGETWEEVGSFTVTAQSSATNATAETYSFPVNETGNGRIRFRQTAGSRWFIDNVAISDYKGVTAVQDIEYHSWDAYCRGGELVIENSENDRSFAVYGMDGLTWLTDTLAPGEHTLKLPKGLYIVVADDFSRRVLVK